MLHVGRMRAIRESQFLSSYLIAYSLNSYSLDYVSSHEFYSVFCCLWNRHECLFEGLMQMSVRCHESEPITVVGFQDFGMAAGLFYNHTAGGNVP